MKKLFAFITALLVFSCVAFADVSVKDLGDGTVEVTFFYGNPKASEVTVAGTFTDWEKSPVAMTKVEKGWELKTIQAADAVLKYKFISDGNWTPDIKAPDTVDDGFGGNNGLVEVAKLVAIEKAKATGDTAALEKLSASSGLRFSTFTQVNLMSNFLTRNVGDPTKSGLETDSVQFRAKSYWKLSGDILPNMPVFMEIKAFDGTKDLYKVDAAGKIVTKAADGLNEFGTGLLFHPFNYMNGNENPLLGHFKAGLNTPYVNLETANNWAKPSKRSSILWETVTDADSNAGYLQFTNGAAVQKFGDVKLDVGVVPNKSTGNLGIRSWLNVAYTDMVTAEVQWNVKSNSTDQTKISEFFDVFEGNVIAGAKFAMAGAEVKAQATMPVASETVEKGIGYKVLASYSTDMFGVTTTFASYQANASMLYGKDDDVKNNQNKAMAELNPWVKPLDGLKVGFDAKMTTTDEIKLKDAHKYDGKLYAGVDLDKFIGQKMNVDVYGKMAYDVIPSEDNFKFNELGVKYAMADVSDVVPSFEVNYGLLNGDKKARHTVISSLTTKPGIGVDVGFGLRLTNSDATDADKDANAMVGFLLGADYKVKALKDGVFFGAFVYNMDPYDDLKDELKFDGYRPDKDIDNFAGKAQFRLGMKWDF